MFPSMPTETEMTTAREAFNVAENFYGDEEYRNVSGFASLPLEGKRAARQAAEAAYDSAKDAIQVLRLQVIYWKNMSDQQLWHMDSIANLQMFSDERRIECANYIARCDALLKIAD